MDRDAEVLKLFENLAECAISKLSKEAPQTNLLFDLYGMNNNNKSKVFLASANWIEPGCASTLLDEGLVQRIPSEGPEKYSLTFKGIVYCIKLKYGISYEDQFKTFLEKSDFKFTSSAKNPLSVEEKLVVLSLLLTASTSEAAAIRLENEFNQRTLMEVFNAVLDFMKKHGIAKLNQGLPKPKRQEFPAAAVMSRVTELPRKTNHYYKYAENLTYYLDIEDQGLCKSKVLFLMKKVFDFSDPGSNYTEWCNELLDISERYSRGFLSRKMDYLIAVEVNGVIKEFFAVEILRMPLLKE